MTTLQQVLVATQNSEIAFPTQVKPNFKDLGHEAPLKTQKMAADNVQGPKIPTSKKPVPGTRKESLFGVHSDRLEMSTPGPMNGMVRHRVVTANSRSRQQPKASLAESEMIKDLHKRDKQGPAKVHHDEISKFVDMHLDTSRFGQPGRSTKDKVSQEYFCNRASGRPAGLQKQQSTRSENVAVTEVCCVCLETYTWKDQRVFTKCCETAIGSYCKAQHIAEFGECWNCGEEEVRSEAVSQAETWVSYDPKDFATEPPPLPLYVAFLPSNEAGREPATAKLDAGSVLPSGSTVEGQGSNNPSSNPRSNTRESKTSRTTQPLFVGSTKELCDREAAMHRSRSRKESANEVRAIPQSSTNLVNQYAKSYASIDNAKTMPPESQSPLSKGSKPAISDLFEDDQLHFHNLTSRTQKQEAKMYVIEAAKHLVEMYNLYGDDIDDNIVDEILEALGGCKTFQVAIDKRIHGTAATLPTPPASVQTPATVANSDLKPGGREMYCSKCEELDFRMKKAANALLGL